MNSKLKYKVMAQKAGTQLDPIALQLIKEMDEQKEKLVEQINFLLKEGGPDLEAKLSKWMYGELEKSVLPEIG
jgi:hypothetical protein